MIIWNFPSEALCAVTGKGVNFMYNAYKKFMKGWGMLEKVITVILMVAVTALTFGNVLSRYILPTAWSFTEEVVINLFAIMSMMGAAMLASRDGGLVSMALLNTALNDKGKRILNLLDVVIGVIFFILIFHYGLQRTEMLYTTNKLTDVLRMKEWYFTAGALVFSSICFFLHYFEFALDQIHALIHGEPEEVDK